MLPPLLVAVVLSEGVPNCANAMLVACSTAMESRTCELAEPASEPQAEVWWQSLDQVRVRVHASDSIHEQSLRFSPSDESCERWRAAGLVVASLYGPRSSSDEPSTHGRTVSNAVQDGEQGATLRAANSRAISQASEVTRLRVAGHVDPSEPSPMPAWILGVGGHLAHGIGSGQLRMGPIADFAVISERLNLGAISTVRQAWQSTSSDGIGFGWYSVGLGILARQSLGAHMAIEGSLQLAREWFVARASPVAGHPEERSIRAYPTLGVRGGLVWRSGGMFEGVAAVESWFTPGQNVWVSGELRGSNASWLPVVLLALRFRTTAGVQTHK